MARKKKPVHRVQMTEEKRNIRKIFPILIKRSFPCMPKECLPGRFLKLSKIFMALRLPKACYLRDSWNLHEGKKGKKEVLTISVGNNESAKYWLSVMNELKNRGVKDVLIILCGWFNWNQRSNRSSFSKDRIPALYCTRV